MWKKAGNACAAGDRASTGDVDRADGFSTPGGDFPHLSPNIPHFFVENRGLLFVSGVDVGSDVLYDLRLLRVFLH